MNITDAKNIPLFQIVQHLGGRYSHTDRNKQVWYFSPLRPQEKTASFKINEQTNKWYDFGHAGGRSATGAGGDVIDLWCDYHGKDRRSAVKEALDALNTFAGAAPGSAAYQRPPERILPESDGKTASRFRVVKLHDSIFYPSLKTELLNRRISPELADKYLRQVYLQDRAQPDKKRNGFAFANDRGGHEISIPYPKQGSAFKTSTTPKSPTTFRAKLSSKLFVFEGFWDFLSWLEMQDTPEPEHNIVVLNSLSFCGEIITSILAAKAEVETVVLFLDNDDAGEKATHLMTERLEDEGFIVRSMASMYQHYKDLNDYWRKDPGAKRITEQKQAQVKYYTEDSAWHMVTAANKARPRHE